MAGKLRASGIHVTDAQGNILTLVGATVDHNEWSKEYFDASDVARMQAHGGNILEIHQTRLGYLKPTRDTVDTTYLAKIDAVATACENAGMYYLINVEDLSWTSWNSGMPDWMLDDHGYGTAPYSETTVNQACLDFWDTDNPLHSDNRQSFIDLWKYLANHFKDKQYVVFSIMNEPISHCPISSRTQSQHLGVTYALFMGQIIDAIQAITDTLIAVDKPYLWYMSDIQPVDRNGIMWEDHYYVTLGVTFDQWKAYVDAAIALFMGSYNKPLNIGEYGSYPIDMTGWQTIFQQQVAYLIGKVPIRQWHTWGALYGESGANFNPQDSETLLSIVYPQKAQSRYMFAHWQDGDTNPTKTVVV